MTRKDMIENLRHSPLYAEPTVQTMDMGLQYDATLSDGALICGLGTMGDWPIFIFHRIPDAKLQRLRKLFNSDEEILTIEELKDTFLHDFASTLRISESDDIKEHFRAFIELDLNDDIDRIYCLCDPSDWEIEFEIFTDEREMVEAFRDKYVYDFTPWEEMEDQQLEYYLSCVDKGYYFTEM